MARSPSTNMNFWARAPLNLVADLVKNSVPPLLRTLRFCVGRQETEIQDHSTDHTWVEGWGNFCRGFRGTWIGKDEAIRPRERWWYVWGLRSLSPGGKYWNLKLERKVGG